MALAPHSGGEESDRSFLLSGGVDGAENRMESAPPSIACQVYWPGIQTPAIMRETGVAPTTAITFYRALVRPEHFDDALIEALHENGVNALIYISSLKDPASVETWPGCSLGTHRHCSKHHRFCRLAAGSERRETSLRRAGLPGVTGNPGGIHTPNWQSIRGLSPRISQ